MLLAKIKVNGPSMEPTLKHNQTVLASSVPFIFRKPRIRDMVIVLHGRFIIKRIVKIKGNNFFVLGDNQQESTDSRNFGWIKREEIIGKVIRI